MFHWHTGTMTRRSEKLEQEVPEAYVEIHPDDVARIGLNGAKRVRVASRRGEIELGVRVTPRIRPGVVFIPFHFAEAAANVLTHAALDPVAKIPEYKVCAVRWSRSEGRLVLPVPVADGARIVGYGLWVCVSVGSHRLPTPHSRRALATARKRGPESDFLSCPDDCVLVGSDAPTWIPTAKELVGEVDGVILCDWR